MYLNVKKLHPLAVMPKYATDGAACFDLHALIPNELGCGIVQGTPVIFRTGLAFEVPPNYALMIYSRSGHGFNQDTRLANCVGVIDSDYRGEVMVKLSRDNHAYRDLIVRHGDRIAQAMLIPVPMVTILEVEELSTTVRGTGGMGSTGA